MLHWLWGLAKGRGWKNGEEFSTRGKLGFGYALTEYLARFLPLVTCKIEWNPTNLCCLAKIQERMLKMPVDFSKFSMMYFKRKIS